MAFFLGKRELFFALSLASLCLGFKFSNHINYMITRRNKTNQEKWTKERDERLAKEYSRIQ